jgi:hypothetical protein
VCGHARRAGAEAPRGGGSVSSGHSDESCGAGRRGSGRPAWSGLARRWAGGSLDAEPCRAGRRRLTCLTRHLSPKAAGPDVDAAPSRPGVDRLKFSFFTRTRSRPSRSGRARGRRRAFIGAQGRVRTAPLSTSDGFCCWQAGQGAMRLLLLGQCSSPAWTTVRTGGLRWPAQMRRPCRYCPFTGLRCSLQGSSRCLRL